MVNVTLYTDGACSGNPGPGGWCAILSCAGRELELAGSEGTTTNNRMELTAVVKGLQKLKIPCEVTVVSDSKYVCDAFNQDWISSWVSNGWRKSNKKPVLNAELWKQLWELTRLHTVSFQWVAGHTGHPENERCDRIAVMKSREIKM